MNSWNSELEIVGFNGKPLVECGRALPVARRKADGKHCVIDLTNGPENLQWYPQEVADEFANEQRWTLFGLPLNLPKKCVDETQSLVQQPMVVYTNQKLLDNADRQFLLACLRALQGHTDECKKWILKSFALGSLPSKQHLLEDLDLERVRRLDWFQELLAKLG